MEMLSLKLEGILQKRGRVCTLTVTLPKACGLWFSTESQLHINELELKAIYLALQAFSERLNNKHVKILCDNSTAVTYNNGIGV